MDSNIHFNALQGSINNDQRIPKTEIESTASVFWFAELKMKPSMLPEGWISR